MEHGALLPTLHDCLTKPILLFPFPSRVQHRSQHHCVVSECILSSMTFQHAWSAYRQICTVT